MEEIDQIKSACKDSLWYLCKRVLWKNSTKCDWDPIHDDMEVFLNRPSRLKLILVPRNHLKTAVITKAWSIQQLLRDPNRRVLIANQVWDKAREMLYEIKEYLTDKTDLPHLFGSFGSNRWTVDDIVIKQRTAALSAASIATTGVEAETTSSHYDDIICDDLQGLQNVSTKEQREKVKKFFRSLKDLADGASARMIVVGTRWHEDDLYQEILDKEAKYWDVMIRKVIENGKPIYPSKFTSEYIQYLKETRPLDEFYSQYYNEPFAEENQFFRSAYLKYFTERPKGLYVAMTVDLAISQKTESDQTAFVVSGMDSKGKIYILDYLAGRWTPGETIENTFKLYSQWKPNVVAFETNGFQRTMKYMVEDKMLQERTHFYIQELHHGAERSKIERIKALEPYYRRGDVFHAEWMKGKDLELELLSFPKGRHDDLIDALASALEVLRPGHEEYIPNIIRPGTLNWALKHEMKTTGTMYERYLKDAETSSVTDWNKLLYGKALERN